MPGLDKAGPFYVLFNFWQAGSHCDYRLGILRWCALDTAEGVYPGVVLPDYLPCTRLSRDMS